MLSPTTNNSSARILVVDDNPVVLAGTSHLLRRAGHEVIEATTRSQCLEQIYRQHPDLVLLDVILPDGFGYEVCRKVKSDPDLRHSFIVLLSGTEITSEQQAMGLDAGADGYIARPIEDRELVARVQSLIRIQQAESALRQAHDDLELRVEERTAQLSQSRERLRALSLRLVKLQEEERRSIARELHDEMGQLLTSAKLSLDLLAAKIADAHKPAIAESISLLNNLMDRVRRLSLDLRPQMLDDLGLIPALEWHVKRYRDQTGIQVEFDSAINEVRFEDAVDTALFRIVQESLTNVARHSKAARAAVRLHCGETYVHLEIADGGKGFDVAAAQTGASTGLSSMRERTELLGGTFLIESGDGVGTRVIVELPFSTSPSAWCSGTTDL